jgi:hypothetical protein
MSSSPSLNDLLETLGAAGIVIGACIGFFLPAGTLREIAENIALVATLGGVMGAIVAFAIYAGLAIGG